MNFIKMIILNIMSYFKLRFLYIHVLRGIHSTPNCSLIHKLKNLIIIGKSIFEKHKKASLAQK